MQSKTLGQLRQQFYERFDEGQSLYIAADEANRLINEAASHFHTWLSVQNPMYMYGEKVLIAKGGPNYPLPTDFHRPIKVWAFGQSLDPLAMTDYNPETGVGPRGYLIKGHDIYLQGLGSVGATGYPANILLGYVPRFVELVADSDILASSVAPGYDSWIVNQAVMFAKVKEESVVNDLVAANDKLESLISQDILQRKMAERSQIKDSDPFSHQSLSFW